MFHVKLSKQVLVRCGLIRCNYIAGKKQSIRETVMFLVPSLQYFLDVQSALLFVGYLQSFCKTLTAELDRLPGDGRTTIGFIAYNSRVHFFSLLSERRSAPHMMTVSDIEGE